MDAQLIVYTSQVLGVEYFFFYLFFLSQLSS